MLLDLDGTLFELINDPAKVKADARLIALLLSVNDALQGRLAIVSGRSLAQIDTMLGSAANKIILSGSHGAEYRGRGIDARPSFNPQVERVALRARGALHNLEGVIVEEKSHGVALHYRCRPDAATLIRGVAESLARVGDFIIQEGKMVLELRAAGVDKGGAIRRLLSRPPMLGTLPIFIGDDVTDEDGFVAVRSLRGTGILVGQERHTAASFRLESPAHVRAWLESAVA